ncbi:glycine-rich domain-containing protein [Chryseolinea lacunae]|uniref:Uncharacterized protein n=1 Tax=Chryseolinea lacunae TaxID=2801331 RepID=A0ABS1KTK2_9BACT|nr:hypothetical protein [Chryseolinea lacunae]MBL0742749.1 hypothetical protein [Chryseolinea lacunae]
MSPAYTALWNSIRSFEVDDPSAAFTFSDRLARENGWTLEFALRAIEEYKRFMFLICISPTPLTPSDAVDQVWHLHLLYTRSYWEDFCEHTLQQKIHHGPTRGGGQERDKYHDWYSRTKTFYASTFNQPPPADLWPPNDVRFRDVNFRRVNVDKFWIIKKPLA